MNYAADYYVAYLQASIELTASRLSYRDLLLEICRNLSNEIAPYIRFVPTYAEAVGIQKVEETEDYKKCEALALEFANFISEEQKIVPDDRRTRSPDYYLYTSNVLNGDMDDLLTKDNLLKLQEMAADYIDKRNKVVRRWVETVVAIKEITKNLPLSYDEYRQGISAYQVGLRARTDHSTLVRTAFSGLRVDKL
jgi:hypothetical protein